MMRTHEASKVASVWCRVEPALTLHCLRKRDRHQLLQVTADTNERASLFQVLCLPAGSSCRGGLPSAGSCA